MADVQLSDRTKNYITFINKELKINMKIKSKEDNWLMKAIGWFFTKTKINPGFSTVYYTTINDTVYVPKGFSQDEQSFMEVIAHESVHAYDAKRLSFPLFALLYLSPQLLAILLLPLAFITPWFLFVLALLAPIPALFRTWFEVRGFRCSILFARKLYGVVDMKDVHAFIVDNFVTSKYYFMFPFKGTLEKILKDESFMTDPVYVKLLEGIQK